MAWGLGDFAGALAARRIGALWTSAAMQCIGAAGFAVLLLGLGRWPVITLPLILWGLLLAAVGAGSLMLLYRGLALGPMAVVSPIGGAYAAVTVILAVLFLGERLTPLQTVAVAVTFAGVLLASTDLRLLVATLGRPSPGVRVGFFAMLGFGIWGLFLALAVRSFDGLAIVLVSRFAGAALMLGAVLARRAAPPADRRRGTLGLVVAVGVFDTIANVSYVLGFEAGYASIVATAGALYPVVTAALAILLLRERLAPNQYAGVGVLVLGLIGLGLAG
ncbi:MAG: DMT family transporter [Candidatus Limnocylindrales bacterium]